jgi:hypothetical protein
MVIYARKENQKTKYRNLFQKNQIKENEKKKKQIFYIFKE